MYIYISFALYHVCMSVRLYVCMSVCMYCIALYCICIVLYCIVLYCNCNCIVCMYTFTGCVYLWLVHTRRPFDAVRVGHASCLLVTKLGELVQQNAAIEWGTTVGLVKEIQRVNQILHWLVAKNVSGQRYVWIWSDIWSNLVRTELDHGWCCSQQFLVIILIIWMGFQCGHHL